MTLKDDVRSAIEDEVQSIQSRIAEFLRSDELADEVNEHLDIPGLPEGLEKQVISALLDKAAEVLEGTG